MQLASTRTRTRTHTRSRPLSSSFQAQTLERDYDVSEHGSNVSCHLIELVLVHIAAIMVDGKDTFAVYTKSSNANLLNAIAS